MDATIGKVIDSVSGFFSGAASGSADEFPLCDTDIISGCEKELAEAQKGQDEGLKKECIMRLSWALVHSKTPADIQRGISMLEASVVSDTSPMNLREAISRCSWLLSKRRLFKKPGMYRTVFGEWGQAQTLKTAIEDRIVKADGVIGVGIAVTAVGVVAGIAAALLR
ncbi:hypothetical protein Bca52824_093366 [Brassica carinata]|uniref:Mitochondrial fission 1 protein n=1 Tax=Brassica carinata TaxID=52824 RepID=A0A8X7TJY8_BRACI|nr:hypothetical protein Bca52824_093366 [Brassica carinata]